MDKSPKWFAVSYWLSVWMDSEVLHVWMCVWDVVRKVAGLSPQVFWGSNDDSEFGENLWLPSGISPSARQIGGLKQREEGDSKLARAGNDDAKVQMFSQFNACHVQHLRASQAIMCRFEWNTRYMWSWMELYSFNMYIFDCSWLNCYPAFKILSSLWGKMWKNNFNFNWQ